MSEVKSIVAYAAYSENVEERLNSSSGGIFSLLAKKILSVGGVVYGVAMSDDCRTAEFVRITDSSDLEKIQGSKYLQAHVGKVFKQVMNDLENNVKVLFSGTGCQVNGLKGFLGKDYDNLYCVDIVCHGTPSPALWKKYVEYIETENNAKLIHVNFRCKSQSWTDFWHRRN